MLSVFVVLGLDVGVDVGDVSVELRGIIEVLLLIVLDFWCCLCL